MFTLLPEEMQVVTSLMYVMPGEHQTQQVGSENWHQQHIHTEVCQIGSALSIVEDMDPVQAHSA